MTTIIFALIVLMNGHVAAIGHYATQEACETQGGAAVEISQTAQDYVCMPVKVQPKTGDSE